MLCEIDDDEFEEDELEELEELDDKLEDESDETEEESEWEYAPEGNCWSGDVVSPVRREWDLTMVFVVEQLQFLSLHPKTQCFAENWQCKYIIFYMYLFYTGFVV